MSNAYYGVTRMKKATAGPTPKARKGEAGAEKAGRRPTDSPINWPGLPGQAGPERNTSPYPTIKRSVVKKGGHF